MHSASVERELAGFVENCGGASETQVFTEWKSPFLCERLVQDPGGHSVAQGKLHYGHGMGKGD